jgi:hypothetical protein
MVNLKAQDHRSSGPCFCAKCREYRQIRYREPAVKELSDKLRAARANQLPEHDPRIRLDECIRVVLSQIDKK